MVTGENVNVTNMEIEGGLKKKSRGSPGVLTDRETKLWLTEMTVLRHLLKV